MRKITITTLAFIIMAVVLVQIVYVPFDDADGDSWRKWRDCNDENASIHPHADEIIGDEIDQDCDPLTDGGPIQPDFADIDKDHWSINAGDCDDKNPSINPDQEERIGDGIDNNCNNRVDEFEGTINLQENVKWHTNENKKTWSLSEIKAVELSSENLIEDGTLRISAFVESGGYKTATIGMYVFSSGRKWQGHVNARWKYTDLNKPRELISSGVFQSGEKYQIEIPLKAELEYASTESDLRVQKKINLLEILNGAFEKNKTVKIGFYTIPNFGVIESVDLEYEGYPITIQKL